MKTFDTTAINLVELRKEYYVVDRMDELTDEKASEIAEEVVSKHFGEETDENEDARHDAWIELMGDVRKCYFDYYTSYKDDEIVELKKRISILVDAIEKREHTIAAAYYYHHANDIDSEYAVIDSGIHQVSEKVIKEAVEFFGDDDWDGIEALNQFIDEPSKQVAL